MTSGLFKSESNRKKQQPIIKQRLNEYLEFQKRYAPDISTL